MREWYRGDNLQVASIDKDLNALHIAVLSFIWRLACGEPGAGNGRGMIEPHLDDLSRPRRPGTHSLQPKRLAPKERLDVRVAQGDADRTRWSGGL